MGFGATIDYLNGIGMDRIAAYEEELLDYGTNALRDVPGLRIVGEASHKASVLSFVLEGIHPHDIGTILDQEGIAVRTGHHCAQPVMDRFDVPRYRARRHSRSITLVTTSTVSSKDSPPCARCSPNAA